jgi:hypothetical protein
MDIVSRVKNICLSPTTEWPVIASETTSTGELMTGYAIPLVAIGVVCGFIGKSLVGTSTIFLGTIRMPIVAGLALAAFGFVMGIVGIFIVSFIIDALAPTFGGQKSSGQALKVAVYAYTPVWVAGVLNIVPALGLLGILAALYALYLLYLGLPRLMKCPEDKAIGYTAVVVVCAIVITFVVGAVGTMVVGAGVLGAGMAGSTGSWGLSGPSARSSPASSEVQFDKNSPLGKLQEFGKKMEESNKKMEAAQKSGDPNAQMTAATEALGTLFGGGKRVNPIEIDQLKPFVPETFAGLPRKSNSAAKTGIAGLMVSKAEATYGDGAARRVTLEISDTGGVSGLMGLASWVGVEEDKEDEYGFERTHKVNGRLIHEKGAKQGGSNEFGIVLGDRFVVSAKGTGVELSDLKNAVSGLALARLESMKDVGAQK